MHDIIEHYGKVVIALAGGYLQQYCLQQQLLLLFQTELKVLLVTFRIRSIYMMLLMRADLISNVRNVYGERTASGADRE